MAKFINKYLPPETSYSEEGLKDHIKDIFNALIDRIQKTANFIKDRKKTDRNIEEKLDLINNEWSSGSYLDNLNFRTGEVKYGGRFPVNTIDKTKPQIDKIRKYLLAAARENKILIKRRAKTVRKAIEFLDEEGQLVSPASVNDFRKIFLKELSRPEAFARENKSILGSLASIGGTLAKYIVIPVLPKNDLHELSNIPYRLVAQEKSITEFFEKPADGKMELLNKENFDEHVSFIKDCIELIESFTDESVKEWDKELGEWFPINNFGEISDFDNITNTIDKVMTSPRIADDAKKEIRQLIDEVIFREFRYFVRAIWGKYNRNLRYVEKTIDRHFHLCQASYD